MTFWVYSLYNSHWNSFFTVGLRELKTVGIVLLFYFPSFSYYQIFFHPSIGSCCHNLQFYLQVIGYTVLYQVADCHQDRPSGCDENEVFNITTSDPTAKIHVPNLRKFTDYTMRVQVYNRKGRGNFSAPIRVRTAEDSKSGPLFSALSHGPNTF